jgi:hypothetical protein
VISNSNSNNNNAEEPNSELAGSDGCKIDGGSYLPANNGGGDDGCMDRMCDSSNSPFPSTFFNDFLSEFKNGSDDNKIAIESTDYDSIGNNNNNNSNVTDVVADSSSSPFLTDFENGTESTLALNTPPANLSDDDNNCCFKSSNPPTLKRKVIAKVNKPSSANNTTAAKKRNRP